MRNITSITDVIKEILKLDPEQNIAYQINAQKILYICKVADDEDEFHYYIAVYCDTRSLEYDEPIISYHVSAIHTEELMPILNKIMDMYGAFTQEELKLMYAAMRHYRENLIEMRRKFYDDNMDDIADIIADKTTTAFNAIEKIRGILYLQEENTMSIENRFSGNVTLKGLKNRILLDKKLLAQHPECKELLERRIANTEKLILDCICNCKNDKLLNEISIKNINKITI